MVGWSLTTKTFVSEMLPLLLTLPVKMSRAPGATGLAGQFLVTVIEGVVSEAQVAVAECEAFEPQMLFAVAVSVSIHGPQSLVGVV